MIKWLKWEDATLKECIASKHTVNEGCELASFKLATRTKAACLARYYKLKQEEDIPTKEYTFLERVVLKMKAVIETIKNIRF